MSIDCQLYGVEESKLASFEQAPAGLADFLRAPQFQVSLDQAWDGIRFLLSRLAEKDELSFIGKGGTAIPGSDVGPGAARYFSATEVGAIQVEISGISELELLAACDQMARADEKGENRDYVRQNYQRLQLFFAGLADRGEGMILRLV